MDFEKLMAELVAKRAAVLAELEQIPALAVAEKRDLNEEELRSLDGAQERVQKIDVQIKAVQSILDTKRLQPEPPEKRVPESKPDVKRTATVPYRHGKVRSFPTAEQAYRFGKWFAGAVLGIEEHYRWCQDAGMELRTMGITANSLGGVLVIPEFEQTIIDLREQYGIARQKCRVSPMSGDTKSVPRRAGGVTAYFVNENSEITASDKSWNNVELTARKLAALCKYSSELEEDAMVSIGDDLANEIAYAFAVKEDTCLFLGDGSSTYGGIVGVKNALLAGSEVTAITGNTAFSTLDRDDFESMIGKLPEYPGIRPEWYISKAGWAASMMRLADAAGGNTSENIANGPPIRTFLGYPVNFCQILNSTLTAQTSTEGICYFGDLSMAATFGSRRGLAIQATRDRYFEYDQLAIKGTERFDIVVHEVGTASAPGPMLQLLTPGS